MEEGGNKTLTPICEVSDLDLSYILSQLSSVSGEVSEKTLEELLRDAESQPPSLSWCLGKHNGSSKEKSNAILNLVGVETPYINKAGSSTNVFKNAIDSLTEMSVMVREKVSRDDLSDKKQECKVKPRTNQFPYKTNKSSVMRTSLNQVKTNTKTVSSCANAKTLKVPKSCTTLNTPSHVTRALRPILTKPFSSKETSNPSFHRFPKKIRMPPAKLPLLKIYREENNKVVKELGKPDLTVGESGYSTCRQSLPSDKTGTCSISGEQSSVRSSLQCKISPVKQPQSEPCQILNESPSKLTGHLKENDSKSEERLNECNTGLHHLETKFEALRIKYESQFQELTEKLVRFENDFSARKSKITPLEKRDFSAQVDVTMQDSNKENFQNHVNTNVTFDFDDLHLDTKFVPWKQPKNDPDILKLNLGRSLKQLQIAPMASGEHRRLVSTVKNLHTEVDTLKKANQRLKNEVSSLQKKKSWRTRGVIKKSMGTQTSFQCHCRSSMTNNDVQINGLLKNKVEALELEIKTLTEKRQLDLTLLQRKHEEEIDILLEQKMKLSKKLDDAIASGWSSFEGLGRP